MIADNLMSLSRQSVLCNSVFSSLFEVCADCSGLKNSGANHKDCDLPASSPSHR